MMQSQDIALGPEITERPTCLFVRHKDVAHAHRTGPPGAPKAHVRMSGVRLLGKRSGKVQIGCQLAASFVLERSQDAMSAPGTKRT